MGYSKQQIQVYNALQKAAERMGRNNYETERKRLKLTPYQANRFHLTRLPHKDRGRGIYTPTQEHTDIIKAMSDVLKGDITPEEGMGLLWGRDVMKQRGLNI